ncbi:unnamed protein product, partial [Hydatigera taeniaeformis]|uniref:Ecdysone-induced protein 74EF n=1 Tax=Hydatigena taeniaeformis TaxID=6205 RepID=A0A0R3WWY7_HYDTA
VHKYHTFRKISPKSQTAPFIATDTGTITTTTTTSNNNSGNSVGRPTTSSQLLKSLLESGGGNGGGGGGGVSSLPNTHASYQPLAPSAVPLLSAPPSTLAPPPSSSLRGHTSALCGSSLPVTATRFNHPPAHQSRGTWQLGGRAIVIGASITTPSNPTHRLQSIAITPTSTPPSTPPPPISTDASSTAKPVEVVASDAVPHPVLHVSEMLPVRRPRLQSPFDMRVLLGCLSGDCWVVEDLVCLSFLVLATVGCELSSYFHRCSVQWHSPTRLFLFLARFCTHLEVLQHWVYFCRYASYCINA